MDFAYLVIYEGEPEDPVEFLRYYIENHIPLLWRFPNIRRVEVERGVEGGDFFMITRLSFDALEDLLTAINSEERGVARADMENFPPFRGTVRRQAVEIMEIPRGD
jgi:uncharacterized protein (TIGR02118 family)